MRSWLLVLSLVVVNIPIVASAEKPPPPASAGAAASSAGTSVSEAEVKALIDRWLSAQNRGSFATYEALYATHFEGIRRSGPRTVRLDRAGWMKDRGRMFKNKMRVEAKDVSIHRTGAGAVVSFTQTWSSGSYRDVGPKQLVLKREKGQLRIAREELLRSTLLAAPKRAAMPVEQLALVVHAVERPWLVIDPAPAAEPGQGAPTLVSSAGGTYVLQRRVAAKDLPEGASRLKGAKFELSGPNGTACEATVSGFTVLARVQADYMFDQGEQGEGEAPSEEERVSQLWDLSARDGRIIAAELDTSSACKSALYGRASSLKAPVVAELEKSDGKLRDGALAQFRKLPAWEKLQGDYPSSGSTEDGKPRTGRWDSDPGATLTVVTLRHPGTGKRLVSVTGSLIEGCGGFWGELWGLWEVGGTDDRPTFTLASDPADGQAPVPLIGVDAAGDGSLQLLHGDGENLIGVVRKTGAHYAPDRALTIPFYGCGC